MDTKLTKKAFLDVYEKTFGNITQSCKLVGIVRQTYYNWEKNDAEFKQQLINIEPKERFLDFLENKLVDKINDGDTTSLIFALKTKAKIRGYVERQEITGAEGLPNDIRINIIESGETIHD